MRLVIKAVDVPGPSGRALVLCDEGGEILPMQTSAILSQGVGEYTQVTVTFVIDGDMVKLDI